MLQELNLLITEYNSNFTKCSTIEQGNIFGRWFLEKIDENELNEEDINNAILGKTRDRGIDGFYYDEEKDTVFLYQFKYKSNGVLSDTEIADFKTLAATLGFDNYTRNTWLDSNKGYLDGALIEVIGKKPRLYFVYVSSIDETRAKNIEDSCLEMIDKSDFIDEIKFYSTGELVKILKNDSGIKRITLADQETRQKDLFEYSSKNGEIKAIVKNISGYDLVKQFSDESSFEANVRIYVGDKGINKKMRETASEEPDMFWFYNNGITIICRDIKDPTGNKGFYTLEGAQVVNGAQTINSLKKLRTSEEKLKNIRVLAKILKIPEKDESIFRKIVEFNNKQNKIDNWQFQSNKPFWKQLRIALLEKSGHSLDLIYKVGLPKRDGAKEIKLKEFVLVNIAYSGHPYLAKQGQAAVFKNVDDENEKNSYYYQIFPKEKLEIENVNEITPADIDRYYYTLLDLFPNSTSSILTNFQCLFLPKKLIS